jgi:hypothetical protein
MEGSAPRLRTNARLMGAAGDRATPPQVRHLDVQNRRARVMSCAKHLESVRATCGTRYPGAQHGGATPELRSGTER